MSGNPYKDEKGHWTNKENDGGKCKHNLGANIDGKPKDFNNWTDAFNYRENYNKSILDTHGNRIIKGVAGSHAYFDNELVGENGEKPDKATQQRYDEIRNNADRITKDLENAGLNLAGKEYNVKSGSSTYRKIKKIQELKKEFANKSDLETLNAMGDVIRFTHEVKNYNELVDGANLVLDTIGKNPDYEIIELDNKWANPKGAYRGIHFAIIDKKTGVEFELQIHSPETLKIKEPLHALYEKQRELKNDDPEWQRLENEQYKLAKPIIDLPPLNIFKLKSFKKEKGGQKDGK